MNINLLEMIDKNKLNKTGEVKSFHLPGQNTDNYCVYAIPLEYLYYNDQNGRINTIYKKYKAESDKILVPKTGESNYNDVFEKFIIESNKPAFKDTLASIKSRGQQEPGVVLPDGRVVDGNRRFTALRVYQKETNVQQYFNAVVLPLDTKLKKDEKTIKELELDLQLGREERVGYDPIDRIFDVYNTIKVEKLMTEEEYKKASGAKSTKGIKRELRLAELIIRFIETVSPGGNSIDKFYLARDLKLDGPIEEIESTLTKLKSNNKEEITDAVMVFLAISKMDLDNKEPTKAMRDLKNNILKHSEITDYFIEAVDDKVDTIIDIFNEEPLLSANDLKNRVNNNEDFEDVASRFLDSTNRLVWKQSEDLKRTSVLIELEDILDKFCEINAEDFQNLKSEEFISARKLLTEIFDIIYKLRKEI